MTISSTTRVAGPFTGTGSTATFPFMFKVFEQQDMLVQTLNAATGAVATLALTTDYSVALNADQDSSPGGSITLTGGNLATGYTLIITTDIAALQNLALANGGAFYADNLSTALDWLTVLIQQMLTQLGRAVQAPLVDPSPTLTLPPAAERAGMVLGFDTNGNLTLVPVGGGGGLIPAAQTAAGAVDGVNLLFTFTAASGSSPVVMIFAGGIYQNPAVPDYTVAYVSGTAWRITFTTAPTQGPITVVVFG